MEHIDVVVVGAGISGIGAAYNLKTRCPQKTYTILEGRSNLGFLIRIIMNLKVK